MAEEEAEEGGEEAGEEKKGLPIKLILIVVGVLALGGGGYFAYTNFFQDEAVEESAEEGQEGKEDGEDGKGGEGEEGGRVITNEDVFENDLTVAANTNVLVAGPVEIPNVTATGNLSVTDELTIPTVGVLTITGTLNIIS